MNLLLVRHGVTTAASGCCVGQTDVTLSAEGTRDALALARSWNVAQVAAPRRIIASDLQRAVASARPFAERFAVPVQLDARLREMSFGDWDGRDWSEIERSDASRFHAWVEHWADDVAPPGGETVAQLRARARSFLTEWRATSPTEDRHPDATTLVVAHAGWIRAALSILLGEPASRMLERRVDHARATIVHVAGDSVALSVENASTIGAV